MAQPSTIDLVTPFDPTGYTQITGAALQQFGSGITAYTDKGFNVVSLDVAGVPQVPNAITTTKWQRYLWIRVGASAVTVYVWNPNVAVDPTYLNWQPITAASIGAGTILNFMLAGGITSDKIVSVSYGSITGLPATFPPGGVAGGDLTGTYPNPSILANAVDRTKLQSDAAVDANRAVGTNHIQNNAVDFATKLKIAGVTPLQILRLNAGGTAWEAVTKLISQLVEPVGGDALKVVQVNGSGTGFQLSALANNRVLQIVSSRDASAVSGSNNVAANVNLTWNTGNAYTALDTTVTPLSAASQLLVIADIWFGSTGSPCGAGLWRDGSGSAAAIQAIQGIGASATVMNHGTMTALFATGGLTPTKFSIRFAGVSGTHYVNQGSSTVYGGQTSTITVVEYL